MNIQHILILALALMALMLALFLIRSAKRPARARLALEITLGACGAVILTGITTAGPIADFLGDGARRIILLPILLALESAVAAFSLVWLLFRKRWEVSKVPAAAYKLTLFFSAALSLALVNAAVAYAQGAFSASDAAAFGILVAGIFYFGPQVLLSIEWRLSITPSPKKLRGEPLLMISAGLLTMGLLGLSGLF